VAIEHGLRSTLRRTVGGADSAAAVGSGDLAVLATPRLLAWMEAATVAAVSGHLLPGQTTVGTRVRLEHTRGTALGVEVEVSAELVHVDGRLLRFEVVAVDDASSVLGRAEVTRVVVDADRFVARLLNS